MKHIPFNIWNGQIIEPSPLPAYIADVTWYNKIKQIRVGWSSEKTNDKERFRDEMLRQKDLFAQHPEWRKQIRKMQKRKADPSDELWPRFMYFEIPSSDFYWVEGAGISR